MSKEENIRTALRSLDGVAIIATQKTVFDHRNHACAESVTFIVAPTEGVYDVHRLNDLLARIETGIQPAANRVDPTDSGDIFREEPRVLKIGFLDRQEEIGTVSMETVVVVRDASIVPPGNGFIDGRAELHAERALIRKIRIVLYPDTEMAARRQGYIDGYQIPIAEINRRRPKPHHPGFIERWLQGRFAGVMMWPRY